MGEESGSQASASATYLACGPCCRRADASQWIFVDAFDAAMKARGGALYVMYGQTEAAPRIACLPEERLPEKRGSAGVALVGGRLWPCAEMRSLLPVRSARSCTRSRT